MRKTCRIIGESLLKPVTDKDNRGGYTIVNIDIALQENMRRQTTFLNVSLAVIVNFLIYIIAPFNDASLVLFM